jgi:chromatin remodeling complex protein RSC6
MADITTELAAFRAEVQSEFKALAKLIRKLRTAQQDPDGEKAKTRATNNGFNRPMSVSDKLRLFLGLGDDEQISRSEVTRRINTYVTTNGLKHPENGRVIILDEKLSDLLNPPTGLQITFLNIQKYLSPHYIKNVPIPETPEARPPPVEVPPTPVKAKRPVVKKLAA